MSEKKFYAVKRGFDKEKGEKVTDLIFDNWQDVKPLVIGYDQARYKGFLTEVEAKTWLEEVDSIDAEKRANRAIQKAKQEIVSGTSEGFTEQEFKDRLKQDMQYYFKNILATDPDKDINALQKDMIIWTMEIFGELAFKKR